MILYDKKKVPIYMAMVPSKDFEEQTGDKEKGYHNVALFYYRIIYLWTECHVPLKDRMLLPNPISLSSCPEEWRRAVE